MGLPERVTMSSVRDACDTILGSAIAADDPRLHSRECAEGTAYEFEDPEGRIKISDYAGTLAVLLCEPEPAEALEVEFPYYSSVPQVTKVVASDTGRLSQPVAAEEHDGVAAKLINEVYRLAS